MSISSGYSGIPVVIKPIKRPANKEILKQWQELDEIKRKKKQEAKLRQEKLKKEKIKRRPKSR